MCRKYYSIGLQEVLQEVFGGYCNRSTGGTYYSRSTGCSIVGLQGVLQEVCRRYYSRSTGDIIVAGGITVGLQGVV